MLNKEIRNKIQNLWDRLWSGGFSNPITAIEQISYLLFMKRLESFHPTTPMEFKWSHYHNWEEEKLVSHLKEKVFEYIKNDLSKEGDSFADAMEDSSFRINEPTLLKDAINFIDSIYHEIEKQELESNQHFQDIQGDVYEHLLKQTSEAGKNGQFRTPRHIIQMITEILDPKPDGKICDLACGSGGFLVGAYQHILTQNSEQTEEDENGLLKGIDGKNLNKVTRKKLKESTFFGFDIDQTMVRIGTMNLMMHGISKPNIVHLDTLSNQYESYEGNEYPEKYKYILANPPFTGKINSVTVSENLNRAYPPKFDKDGKRIKQTVQSELLFLERIVFMLEEGGKAAVVVPEGLLFNSGKAHKEIRRILMTDCNLKGVISLPEGVFQPYTAVKTSILIFEKRKLRNDKSQKIDVWFYELKSDGYSLDATRRKLKNKPIPKAISAWKNRDNKDQSNRKLQHFKIPYQEIEQNGFELNLNHYQEFVYEPKNFRKPKEILQQLNELESEILKGLEIIKENEF